MPRHVTLRKRKRSTKVGSRFRKLSSKRVGSNKRSMFKSRRTSRHSKSVIGNSKKSRFGRRRLQRRSNGLAARAKITNILAPENIQTGQRAEVITTNASVDVEGLTRTFFTWNSNSAYGVGPAQMKAIAQNIAVDSGTGLQYLITTGAFNQFSFYITQFQIQHQLTNASNDDIHIIARKCIARRDLPASAPYTKTTNSVLIIIAQGFATSNLDPADITATNDYLRNQNASIYQSQTFVDAFKIVKTVKSKIHAGSSMFYNIIEKRIRKIKPNRFCSFAATQTFADAAVTHSYIKGESFWLFEAVPGDLMNNATTGTTTLVNAAQRINMNTKITYTYKYCPVSSGKQWVISGTPAGVATAVDPRFTNEDTATVVLLTNA